MSNVVTNKAVGCERPIFSGAKSQVLARSRSRFGRNDIMHTFTPDTTSLVQLGRPTEISIFVL